MAGVTHNTQDQRLATADKTTPHSGIASPLHPLVLFFWEATMGNILSKIAEENGWDGDGRPLTQHSPSAAPDRMCAQQEIAELRSEVERLRDCVDSLKRSIDRHAGRVE